MYPDSGMISRPFADEADYARLRQLLIAMVAVGDERHYCTIGDLDWWRYTDGDLAQIFAAQLWFTPADDLIGCAWPVGAEVILFSDPWQRGIEAEMLAWATAQRQQAAADKPLTLTAYAFDGDAVRVALLQGQGYQRQEQGFRYRRQDLRGALPTAPLPAGYTVRALAGPEEVAGRVAAHRAAFAPSRMTVEKHNAVRAAPTYRQDLDLVAVGPDGQIAAYALVWHDPANRIGVFEPVGTDPTHQRRGLGAALLAEGLRRLQALEAQTAYINTSTANVAANRLYAAMGFTVVDESHPWVRTLAQ